MLCAGSNPFRFMLHYCQMVIAGINYFMAEESVKSEIYFYGQGYLISFNFNKKKEVGVKEYLLHGKRIVEAIV